MKFRKIIASLLVALMVILPVDNVKAENSEQEEQVTEEVATTTDAASMEEEEFILDENIKNTYIDIGERVDYFVPASEVNLVNSATLPSSYDSRTKGYITDVKDQNPYGTCWSFSAMGASESSMIAQGYVDDADYSEFQFAYFFYHNVADPLGNLTNDSTTPTTDSYLDVGGNNLYSMFALASWKGVVQEAKAPYETVVSNSNATLASSLAYTSDVAHMQNAYIVSLANQADVKSLIMEYGAVASEMYMDTYYYKSSTQGYYQSVSEISNHAILVVGWDDNYAVSNFKTSCQPQQPGAWLIKNSWGEGDVDYFWISYEDACMSQADGYAFICEPADNYDYNYQYDGSHVSGYISLYNDTSVANVYTISGAKYQQIEAASIALADDNIQYSLQFYLNPSDGNPLSGTPMLATPQTGTTTYAGYYTIELETPFDVKKGDKLAVVFTLSNLDFPGVLGAVKVYIDCDFSSNYISFDSYTEPNQSYFCEDGYCTDLGIKYADRGYCPRVKAFSSIAEPTTIYNGVDYSAVYNFDYYMAKYGDLRAAYGNDPEAAIAHFVDHGMSEGRQGSAEFNVETYKSRYADLRNGFGSNLKLYYMHYINNGKAEGRSGKGTVSSGSDTTDSTTVYNGVDYSAVYNFKYYIARYGDLRAAYSSNPQAALEHFVNHGMDEGRQGSSEFNVQTYKNRYPDLRNGFGSNLRLYYMHYINNGKAEGRSGKGTASSSSDTTDSTTIYNGVDYSAVYNFNYYMAKYGDLRAAYSSNPQAALEHFVNHGMSEGRQGSSEFNVNSYMKRYADLRNGFGSNLKLYYMHYINNGKAEGRIGK